MGSNNKISYGNKLIRRYFDKLRHECTELLIIKEEFFTELDNWRCTKLKNYRKTTFFDEKSFIKSSPNSFQKNVASKRIGSNSTLVNGILQHICNACLLCVDCVCRFTRQKHIFHDYYQIFLPNDLVMAVVVVAGAAAGVLQTKLRSNGSENDSSIKPYMHIAHRTYNTHSCNPDFFHMKIKNVVFFPCHTYQCEFK